MTPRAPNPEELERKRRAGALMRADRQGVLVSSPFLGVLAMRLELVPVIDSRVPTAVTDGHAVYAHADFWLELGEAQRLFVLGHEIWHCALQHFARRLGREPRRWNLAVDHEVNDLLVREGFEPLAGAVHFERLRGENAENVYERLGEMGGLPERDPRHADLHELPGPDPSTSIQDPDYAPRQDPEIWRSWATRVRAAAQQARAAGTLPGWLEARIEAAGPPSVPWQRYLQRFIQQVRGGGTRWLPPSRRHWGRGLYLPSRRTERLDLAVAVDTSGSTVEHWPQFRAELGGILRTCDDYRLRLLQLDTRVTEDHIYTPSQPLPAALPIHGAGGTDLRAPFEHLQNAPPTALVVMTDGFGPTPQMPPAYPVLWALTPGASRKPGWGQTTTMRAPGHS
ncbi:MULTISPECIES: vWA domain-containing protein [unclassified Halorhodospira]|uniref:vWA domain-containing protein n=1 Tax=unclassified Halorhodospira TaxID=2626748 RepID=UPI001EE8FF5C|nr:MULTISPECIES: VWA-like domain-containing protein [unclassified Halorhodospira]MCG5541938.1 VWA-like domain-containing protein [Halorhodospira sp. M39old]MCG5547010.1 VWA-like domain-containing protein [Halorhodospira sp. M38]